MLPTKSAPAQLSPLSLIRMITKHKIAVVTIWLIGCLIGFFIVINIPAVYRSEALILVDSQKIPEKYVLSTVNSDLQDRLASIKQTILSGGRLKKLIDDLDLYKQEKKNHVQEEIIEMMRKDIDITLEKGWSQSRPGAFRISYQGQVPTTVAEVATRIMNFFLEENLRNRENQAQGTFDFIDTQLSAAQKRLDTLEAAVSKYKIEHNGELPQQESSLNGMLSRLQIALQSNEESMNRAQQNRVMTENALSMAESAESSLLRAANTETNPAGPDASFSTSDANRTRAPRKQSELLEEQLKLMLVRYSDTHPDVKRIREDLARVKAAEAKEPERAAAAPAPLAENARAAAQSRSRQIDPSSELGRQINQAHERVGSLKATLKLANHELETRSNEQKRILEEIRGYQKRIERLPVREQEMEAITRDYEMSKIQYKSLLEKKAAAQMATEMERREKAERFTPLDQPRVPEKPFSPNRPVWMLAASVLSLILAAAYPMAREIKRDYFLGEWELPAHVVAIGRVPLISFAAASSASSRFLRRALVSSAVISLLGVLAVGLYVAWNRL
jgi:polysaccharide chain length determinant protein (PEP-CTERM system associated)